MTKSIITNSRVGIGMSDLEARARSGCPLAQMEMTKRCMQFSVVVTDDAVTHSMTRKEQAKEMKHE